MIKVNNLRKVYRTGSIAVEALKDVTLTIGKGEFVAVMGPSGSGKSTFMNLLGLLDSPSEGSYWLEGRQVSALDTNELARLRNQKLGFVFQAFNLIPALSALKNVELPMLYAGVKPEERRRRASFALERVGLGERLQHRPNELSGGQNQRVAIARAIVNSPAVIMADEPTGALDTKTGEEIMGIFKELHQEGTTIVLVTHEPDIARHAKRILRFKDGLLISDEEVPEHASAAEVSYEP
ncbi:ABC transporter ATP-binding protein [Desulfotomaculum sp. 1211_IL3151]|uniref:ABC transporter ATP-binding protein n=1 Tax=Desulfotomaculum sp. 1211_IL3151 TaxID=3084055 RepID=UPI002FD96DF7